MLYFLMQAQHIVLHCLNGSIYGILIMIYNPFIISVDRIGGPMEPTATENEETSTSVPSGFTDTPQQRARKITNLASLQGVIREHKRIYKEAMRGNIEIDDLAKLSMVLHRISTIMEASELDDELSKMKDALIEKGIMRNTGR